MYLLCLSQLQLKQVFQTNFHSSEHASALQVVTMMAMMAATSYSRSMPHNENHIHIIKRSPVNPITAPLAPLPLKFLIAIGPPLAKFQKMALLG